MNWKEWTEKYPARKVTEKPESLYDLAFDNYVHAVQYKDYLEMTYDLGGYEIVQYGEKWYIINRAWHSLGLWYSKEMMSKKTRVDIKGMLANPITKRAMMIDLIVVAATMEGIDTTPEQAAMAYDKVQREKVKASEFFFSQQSDNALKLSSWHWLEPWYSVGMKGKKTR